MPKKADIQPDPPEEARARFEMAVDAAVTAGPRPSSKEAKAVWARIAKGPTSKPKGHRRAGKAGK